MQGFVEAKRLLLGEEGATRHFLAVSDVRRPELPLLSQSGLSSSLIGARRRTPQVASSDQLRLPTPLDLTSLAPVYSVHAGCGRPAHLASFDDVLGFISLNGDRYVTQKLQAKGERSLSFAERQARKLLKSVCACLWVTHAVRYDSCCSLHSWRL